MSPLRVVLSGEGAADWQATLDAVGFTGYVVRSTEQVPSEATRYRADVVLLGPDPDPEVLRRLRTADPGVSVIAVAQAGTDMTALLTAGADEVLTAPVMPADLFNAVIRGGDRRRLLGLAGSDRARDIMRVMDVLARAHDRDALLRELLRVLLSVLGGHDGAAYLPDASGGSLNRAAGVESLDRESAVAHPAEPPREAIQNAQRADRTRVVDGRFLLVPLTCSGRLTALLCLAGPPGTDGPAYDAPELAFIESIRGVAAAALDRVLLTEKICFTNAELRGSFDAYIQPVAVIAPDLTVNRINMPLADLLRIHPREAVGRSLVELFPQRGRSLHRTIAGALENRVPVSVEVLDPVSGEESVEIEVCPRVEDGCTTSAMVVIRRHRMSSRQGRVSP